MPAPLARDRPLPGAERHHSLSEGSPLIYQLASELVLALHFAFALFAIFGGLAVLRYPWLAWLHVPALFWATLINLVSWTCPLTPLENHFRRQAGSLGYDGTFIEEYIAPVLYPGGMTREVELLAAFSLSAWNLLVYGLVLRRRRTAQSGTRT